MTTKILTIFKEPFYICKEHTASNINYVVSLRDAAFLKENIKISYEMVDSYEDISEYCYKEGNINYDDINWLDVKAKWFRDLIFLPNINNLKLISFFSRYPKNMVKQNSDLQVFHLNTPIRIELEKVIVEYKWYMIFNNQHDFENAFNYSRSELLDTLHLGNISDIEVVVTELVNHNNRSLNYKELLDTDPSNVYILWIDSEYDVFDPIYYMKKRYENNFENWISEKANEEENLIYKLPKYDAIIWNWVHYGIIPVLKEQEIN